MHLLAAQAEDQLEIRSHNDTGEHFFEGTFTGLF